MKWLAKCFVNLYDLSHSNSFYKYLSPLLPIPLSQPSLQTSSQFTLRSEHSKASMRAYEMVRFVLLCTVCILKLVSYDNIVMASTIFPSGKLDLVIFLPRARRNVMCIPDISI